MGLRSLHPFAPSNLFRDGEEDDDDGIRMTKESKNIDWKPMANGQSNGQHKETMTCTKDDKQAASKKKWIEVQKDSVQEKV